MLRGIRTIPPFVLSLSLLFASCLGVCVIHLNYLLCQRSRFSTMWGPSFNFFTVGVVGRKFTNEIHAPLSEIGRIQLIKERRSLIGSENNDQMFEGPATDFKDQTSLRQVSERIV